MVVPHTRQAVGLLESKQGTAQPESNYGADGSPVAPAQVDAPLPTHLGLLWYKCAWPGSLSFWGGETAS